MSGGTDSGDDERRPHLDDTMPASPPAMEPPARPSSGERYRLGAELGRGGMGRVVEAFDMQLGRSVALKEALPRGGQGTFRRFAREVQITARLEHASIVPLYDSGTTADGRPFYVMRKVSGRPLDELIARARGLPERLALLPALLAAMDAIAHAHKRGVIHRDLKPANILVGELGETVVIDWGLAKVIGESDDPLDSLEPRPSDSLHTVAGAVFGTPGFMAPEQARGEELSTRGDVYALGACMYQLLAGTPPFGGSTSATEVIDRTRKNQIRPLVEASPGAPKELVAIVHKALAFEPEKRYANAALLGEDVRRFTQGQLVAAYNYTRRQRFARFAKRHRLPLVIAAASTVAIAALSWINVHRIMVERQMAVDEQVRTQAHADELLIQNAYNYLDSDPTHALAVLRGLDPSSSKTDEARSIAEAAVARGVAWAIDVSDEDVLPPDISFDGKRLAVTSFSGQLQIYDLDTQALLRTKSIGRGSRGIWVDGGKRLFVFGGTAPPYLLDPTTNQSVPIGIDRARWAVASAQGERVLYQLDDHTVGVFDVATNTPRELTKGARAVTLSSDALWYLVEDSQSVALHDLTGVTVSTLPVADARATWLMADGGKHLAVAVQKTVWEYDIAAGTWTPRPLDLGENTFLLYAMYRGDELSVLTSEGRLLGWVHDHWIERQHSTNVAGIPAVAADGVALLGSSNQLGWESEAGRGTVNLPSFTPLRIGARPGVSRIALAGKGLVLVYDLAQFVPRHLPVRAAGSMFTFIDDDTLLLYTNGDPWTLFDLRTQQRTEIPVKWMGAVSRLDAMPSEKRALLVFAEMRSHLLEIRDDPKPLRHLASGPGLPDKPESQMVARLIPGDVTMFADNDNRLYATFGDAHPNEIAQLDGSLRSITPLGPRRFAAISDNGELVRGSLDGKDAAIERARVPARDDLIVENDMHGHLLIAAGRELLQWDTDIQVVKKFERPIVGLAPMDGGVIVQLADQSITSFDLADKRTMEIAPHNTPIFDITDDGKLFVGLVEGGNLRVASLPNGLAWQLPIDAPGQAGLSVSGRSRRVVVGLANLAMWQLPLVDGDLQAWIAAHTNALERSRLLVWPWQVAPK